MPLETKASRKSSITSWQKRSRSKSRQSRKPDNMRTYSEEQTKQNEALAAKYNQNGEFPLVVLTDENGNVISKTGYKAGGPEKYIAHLKQLQQ